jgi:type IV pilus assembly protein PilM
VDPAQLSRLVGQGRFSGREIALVLSPPDVEFFPLRLPDQVLTQPPDRVEQALKWEVSRESRHSADNLEVRYWRLPHGHAQQPNVMAVVMPADVALNWCRLVEQHGLVLRRIDVSPCALVRLARCLWTPGDNDVWGVLDLGLRHSTLSVVVGGIPAYIRSLSVSSHDWTQAVAEAFELPTPTAEQLKRQHGVQPGREQVPKGDRPLSGQPEGRPTRDLSHCSAAEHLLHAGDLPSALASVLRESLQTLAHEVGRCFSYVMQSFPDSTVECLLLAGGGARLAGLPTILEAELGLPVRLLAIPTASDAPPWEHPIQDERRDAGPPLDPQAAASLGGAILDLEAAGAGPERGLPPGAPRPEGRGSGCNLVPIARLRDRARIRRRAAWLGACLAAGLLIAAGWSVQRAAAAVVARLSREVAALEIQRTEAQRRLVNAGAQRSQLLARLQTVASARRPQPWAQRLTALTREAPQGIFLTAVTIAEGDQCFAAGKPFPGIPTATGSPAASGTTGPEVGPAAPGRQSVRLLGYALDHGALIQLLNTLQNLPGWQQVELVRATAEPFRRGSAVAFELACQTQEDRP